jgi:hypothetical protein
VKCSTEKTELFSPRNCRTSGETLEKHTPPDDIGSSNMKAVCVGTAWFPLVSAWFLTGPTTGDGSMVGWLAALTGGAIRPSGYMACLSHTAGGSGVVLIV